MYDLKIRDTKRKGKQRFFWRLQAKNGEIVANSGGEGFSRRHDAIRNFQKLKITAAQYEWKPGFFKKF